MGRGLAGLPERLRGACCRSGRAGVFGVGEPINGTVATDIKTILKLTVPVIVLVGDRRLSMDDVLALGPGAIVELSKSAEDDLVFMINNKPVGTGVAVKVGENFGIRILEIGSVENRIQALAG